MRNLVTNISRPRLFFILYFASFVLGSSAPIIGITVQLLSLRLTIPLEQMGIFTSAHSLGAAFGTILLGRLFDKHYPRFLLYLSPACIAVSLLLLNFLQSAWLVFLACTVMGFGFGGLLIQLNILCARVADPRRISAALNLLNLLFGLGLILSPTLVAFSPYLFVGFLAVLATLVFAFFPLTYVEAKAEEAGTSQFRPILILFALIFFLQLGSEVGVRAWLSTQMSFVDSNNIEFFAGLAVSLFGLGILLGRGLAAVFGQHLSAKALLILSGIILASGAGLFLLASKSAWLGLLASLLLGLAYAPLFPTFLAVLEAYEPESFGRLTGIFLFIGNLGAIFIPWVQGIAGAGESGGMQITLVSALLLIGLFGMLPQGEKRKNTKLPA
jgi:MFS family permease